MAEIFFSPVTAIHENKPPGTLVVGVPGGGKSFCMLNMGADGLESGCRIFVLDAKNDMLPLRNLFPDVKVTDVNSIAPGALDPFLVFEDIDATVILTIIEILCGELTADQKLAVSPIVSDFVTRARLDPENGATFKEFADYLWQNDNESARLIGNQLLLNAESPYGPLIFGEVGKKARGIKLNKESRIISIFGMNLPSGSSIPRPDELLNSAVVYIICRMIQNILKRKDAASKIPTILMLDECHMLMRSAAITDVIDEFLVLGRSLNVAVVMASQNVTHFRQDMAQQIATRIAFRMSKQESEEFFRLFDTSNNDKEIDLRNSIDLVTRLKTGYCFIIDSKGRAGLAHVDSNYDISILTSNALKKQAR